MKSINRKTKTRLVILSLSLVMIFSAGAVIAYMLDRTTPVQNTFEPGKIVINVDETFTNNVKTNVKITSVPTAQNGSNIDCYIRVTYVVNWMDADGNVLGRKPVEVTDYTITFNNDSGWTKGTDGYWYYSGRISPGGSTPVLITECKPVDGKTPDGYYLNVHILAQAIQADGVTAPTQAGGSSHPAIEDAWNHAVSAGN